MSAASLSPQSAGFSPAGARVDADREADTRKALADDVQTTMALWQRAGLTTSEVWLALGQRRRHVGTHEIYDFMMRWAARPWRVATQHQLPLIRDEGTPMDWYRAYHGTSADPKWRIIAADSAQPVHAIVAVWHAMLECASAASERGRLIGWNDRVVAVALDLDIDQVVAIKQAMQGLTLDGDLIIAWRSRQPLREDPTAAERQRKSRSHRKANGHDVSRDVTHGHDRTEKIQNRGKKIRTQEREPPPLTPPPPAEEGKTLPPDFDLPQDWVEAAQAERADVGLPEINLAAQWAALRNHDRAERRTMAEWHRRWIGWALNARAAPRVGPPPDGAAPATAADSVDHAERTWRLFWGRDPDWWRQYPAMDQIKAQHWVDHDGGWNPKWFGGPPGSPNCNLDPKLAAAAIAELERRRGAQLTPAATSTAADPPLPRRRRKPAGGTKQNPLLMPLDGGVAETGRGETPATAANGLDRTRGAA